VKFNNNPELATNSAITVINGNLSPEEAPNAYLG
jgi:hypothetical protein